MEMAQVEQTRKAAGNTSTYSSVQRLDGLDGDELERELARIEKEKQEAMPQAPPAIKLPPKAGAPTTEQAEAARAAV